MKYRYNYDDILKTLQYLVDGPLLIEEADIERLKEAIDIVELDSLNPDSGDDQ